MVVYVLFKYDSSTKKDHPIGVVTDEELADSFYKQDPKQRDYFPFTLDEVPEITGNQGNFIPTSPSGDEAKGDEAKIREEQEVAQIQKRMEETTRKMKSVIDRINKRKKQ